MKNNFENNVKFLENLHILKYTKHFGYKIKEKNVLNKLSINGYIKSKIDGCEYCIKNGKFAIHLKKNKISLKDYLINYEESSYYWGYVFNGHGLQVTKIDGWKDYFNLREEEVENVFKIFRSVVTSATSSIENIMFFYGIQKEEAEKIRKSSYKKASKSHLGPKNPSYGRKGENAFCFRPFNGDSDNFKEFIQKKKEKRNCYIKMGKR